MKDTAGLSRSTMGAVQFVESLGGKVVRSPGGPIREVYFTHTWTQNAERLAKAPPKYGQYPLPYSRLKNSALEVLESFSELRVLDISASMVTDDGLTEIAKLKTLRKLVYTPGFITDAGIAELKKALPECARSKKIRSHFCGQCRKSSFGVACTSGRSVWLILSLGWRIYSRSQGVNSESAVGFDYSPIATQSQPRSIRGRRNRNAPRRPRSSAAS